MTLHNIALMNMEDNPTQGFEKLQFLLQQVSCPPGELVLVSVCVHVCVFVLCRHLGEAGRHMNLPYLSSVETFANLLLLYVKYEVRVDPSSSPLFLSQSSP